MGGVAQTKGYNNSNPLTTTGVNLKPIKIRI